MVQQRVDQRVFVVTRARMNRHASMFVNDDQIVVFEQNLQWNRLRFGLDFFWRRISEFNLIACSYNLMWPGDCAVQTNEPRANQLLDTRTREFRKCCNQMTIDA